MARERSFRLDTERLTIRTMVATDVTEFTRYRNLEAIARYQDWPLPYTRDLAHELVDEMQLLGGPTGGRWVQLALDAGTGIVGDIAVWLDADENVANVGYTLAPDNQGLGYAVEAVEAIVDWLFRQQRVHRVTATIDPHNMASARVLERCGFRYEGTARSAAFIRHEWSDDARFSLLEPDWLDWSSRPTGPPGTVALVEITNDNVRAVGEIDRSFSQRDLVAPVLVSLVQALVPRVVNGEAIRPWVRAIEADGELAGFVMLAEPHDANPHPYLWRYLIDTRHQGRGIGRRALLEIARQRRHEGATHLSVNFVPDVVGSPAQFYEGLGFALTGVEHHGEVEALLDLSMLPD